MDQGGRSMRGILWPVCRTPFDSLREEREERDRPIVFHVTLKQWYMLLWPFGSIIAVCFFSDLATPPSLPYTGTKCHWMIFNRYNQVRACYPNFGFPSLASSSLLLSTFLQFTGTWCKLSSQTKRLAGSFKCSFLNTLLLPDLWPSVRCWLWLCFTFYVLFYNSFFSSWVFLLLLPFARVSFMIGLIGWAQDLTQWAENKSCLNQMSVCYNHCHLVVKLEIAPNLRSVHPSSNNKLLLVKVTTVFSAFIYAEFVSSPFLFFYEVNLIKIRLRLRSASTTT